MSIGLAWFLVMVEGPVAEDRRPALSADLPVLAEHLRDELRRRRGDRIVLSFEFGSPLRNLAARGPVIESADWLEC